MNLRLIEADFFAPIRFYQRAVDQQWVVKHELQRFSLIQQFGRNLAGFNFGGRAVEPLGYGAFTEKIEQAFLRPWFGEQIARDDLMPGGGKQRLLFGVVAAAGFFVKDDLSHRA